SLPIHKSPLLPKEGAFFWMRLPFLRTHPVVQKYTAGCCGPCRQRRRDTVSMRVLVTGSTGFIGSALTRKLQETASTIRVLVRDPDRFSRAGLEVDDVVEGDITDPAAVEAAVKGVDVVYAIAGTFREPNLTDERYRAINVNAVSHMLSAASRQGVKRVVHCSTCGIHGSISGPPADENYPIRPNGIYEVTKAAGEALA